MVTPLQYPINPRERPGRNFSHKSIPPRLLCQDQNFMRQARTVVAFDIIENNKEWIIIFL